MPSKMAWSVVCLLLLVATSGTQAHGKSSAEKHRRKLHSASADPVVLRLYCGDSAFTDVWGKPWASIRSLADTKSVIQGAVDDNTVITGAADALKPVYKTECGWTYVDGDTTLDFPVPEAGIYKVDILNMEPWWEGAMTAGYGRKFDILADGVTQVANLDLFVQAHGKFKATNNTFLTKVATGSATLKMKLHTIRDRARFSGIVITKVSFPYRVQCNTESTVDGWGNPWYSVDSTKFLVKRNSELVQRLTSANIQLESIYQRECLPASSSGDMSMSIPVPKDDCYDVTVLQTEPYCDGVTKPDPNTPACHRIFNIEAEGTTKVQDLEILTKAPCPSMHTAYNSTFSIMVTDGALDLHFVNSAGSSNFPRFSAIYVAASASLGNCDSQQSCASTQSCASGSG